MSLIGRCCHCEDQSGTGCSRWGGWAPEIIPDPREIEVYNLNQAHWWDVPLNYTYYRYHSDNVNSLITGRGVRCLFIGFIPFDRREYVTGLSPSSLNGWYGPAWSIPEPNSYDSDILSLYLNRGGTIVVNATFRTESVSATFAKVNALLAEWGASVRWENTQSLGAQRAYTLGATNQDALQGLQNSAPELGVWGAGLTSGGAVEYSGIEDSSIGGHWGVGPAIASESLANGGRIILVTDYQVFIANPYRQRSVTEEQGELNRQFLLNILNTSSCSGIPASGTCPLMPEKFREAVPRYYAVDGLWSLSILHPPPFGEECEDCNNLTGWNQVGHDSSLNVPFPTNTQGTCNWIYTFSEPGAQCIPCNGPFDERQDCELNIYWTTYDSGVYLRVWYVTADGGLLKWERRYSTDEQDMWDPWIPHQVPFASPAQQRYSRLDTYDVRNYCDPPAMITIYPIDPFE